MVYVDSSLLVSTVTPEEGSVVRTDWLARQPGPITISHWVTTEVCSALARKQAAQRITVAEHAASMRRYRLMVDESFAVVPVESENFIAAAEIASQVAAGIRAGDALHLAIAHSLGLRLITADQRFASGAASLGYDVELIA